MTVDLWRHRMSGRIRNLLQKLPNSPEYVHCLPSIEILKGEATWRGIMPIQRLLKRGCEVSLFVSGSSARVPEIVTYRRTYVVDSHGRHNGPRVFPSAMRNLPAQSFPNGPLTNAEKIGSNRPQVKHKLVTPVYLFWICRRAATIPISRNYSATTRFRPISLAR
jgi:hypothetical protein